MIPEGERVVAPSEMARIEALSYQEGACESEFMTNAAEQIVTITDEYILMSATSKRIAILVGKGNNGGDALTAAIMLKELGYEVAVYAMAPKDECSPLSQTRFGDIPINLLSDEIPNFQDYSLILDGLCGTGFKGEATGLLKETIEAANASGLPIIAIDIPSGLNGTTGEVGTVAIKATITIYLGCAKRGFYFGEGWNHVGQLIRADFGLDEKYIERAESHMCLLNESILPTLMPQIERTRHKYSAGYVVTIAGSAGMSGAAALATAAALRTGSGMVRLFHPTDMNGNMPLEVVSETWDLNSYTRIEEELSRAASAIVGPGIGRSNHAERMLEKLLPKLNRPTLFDADALYFLAMHPQWRIPNNSILTPHHGEMKRFVEDVNEKTCQQFVEKHQCTLVLKGAPTFIFHPGKRALILTHGDPGMATAGCGDVLSGIIGALLSAKLAPREAAALGVYLHGIAGELAAAELGSASMIASDIISHLPEALLSLE